MKRIFGRNQVVITALALMIAVAGYLSLTQDKNTTGEGMVAKLNVDGTKDDNGDAVETGVYDLSEEDTAGMDTYQVAETGDIIAEPEIDTDVEKSTETPENEEVAEVKETGNSNAGEAVFVSGTIGKQYFDSAKLQREQTRSKNKEILMELVNSQTATDAQKDKAVNEVITLTSNSEKETAAEAMLEAKGYGECIVSIVDEKADVIVNAANLEEKDMAKIQDVIKRKTDIKAENIVITPVGVAAK